MSGLRLKSLYDFYPESTELIRKGVCFPPTASPTQPFLNQDKDFLSFFCSYHNFCYSMSMITALRGASLTPHTRINLLLQQEKRKQGTNIFPQSTKISSLHMEMLKILVFFSLACIPKFPVFSPPGSLCVTTPNDTLPHFLWANSRGTPGHSTVTRTLHHRSSWLQGRNSPRKNVILKKKKSLKKLNFNSHLTHRQFSSWMDQLCKANMVKGKSFQKFHEKQKQDKENTFIKDP